MTDLKKLAEEIVAIVGEYEGLGAHEADMMEKEIFEKLKLAMLREP